MPWITCRTKNSCIYSTFQLMLIKSKEPFSQRWCLISKVVWYIHHSYCLSAVRLTISLRLQGDSINLWVTECLETPWLPRARNREVMYSATEKHFYPGWGRPECLGAVPLGSPIGLPRIFCRFMRHTTPQLCIVALYSIRYSDSIKVNLQVQTYPAIVKSLYSFSLRLRRSVPKVIELR